MKLLLERYCFFLKVIMTVLMAFMIVPVSLQILSRSTGIIPRYIWTEEVARFCFVWIIMIGSMVAVRDGTHFDVDLMPPPKTKREQGVSQLIVHLGMLVLSLVFAWYGIQFARFGGIQHSEMSGISMLSIYISFPVAGVTWVLFLVEKIIEDVGLITNKPTGMQA